MKEDTRERAKRLRQARPRDSVVQHAPAEPQQREQGHQATPASPELGTEHGDGRGASCSAWITAAMISQLVPAAAID
jgi:hypothetical protein